MCVINRNVAARGSMAAGRVAEPYQGVPAGSGGVNTLPGADRRVGAALTPPVSTGDRMTTPTQTARIPRWPLRCPMAPPCAIGEHRKALYVSDANSVGVGLGKAGSGITSRSVTQWRSQ